jgi:SAM-dependent methyltransferase
MAGSRRERLVDRRAGRLLARAAEAPALVVEAAGGFPCAADLLPAPALRAGALGEAAVAVAGEATTLPFAEASFRAVIDTSRPEAPADHAAAVREMIRVCRPGGVVAAVACGGGAGAAGRLAPRGFASLLGAFAAAGCTPVAVVPFDLLGPSSPWRRRLPDGGAGVLAELDEHLRAGGVRRAFTLVEEEVAALLDPEDTARVLVVARRGPAPAWRAQGTAPERLVALRAAPGLRARALELMADDAVVLAAALLSEILTLADVPFDLATYLREASVPAHAALAIGALRGSRRFWSPGLEVRRLHQAASHRLARRAIRALAAATDEAAPARLAETLEYDIVARLHALLEET